MRRSSLGAVADDAAFVSDDVPDDSQICTMHEKVLDFLLTPPNVKQRLVDTQSVQQKWKIVKAHKQLFEKAITWGDKERSLLRSIAASKGPDLQLFSSLKIMLSSANREFMSAFLQEGGVATLMKAILYRVPKRSLTELDVAVLYEIMLCCKLVMNNKMGMNGFLAVSGSLDAVALTLKFEFKYLALQVLEILSVCCFSEASTAQVLHGMRVLARSNFEAPFACLSNALQEQDVEVKTAVMTFVNSLVIGASLDDHILLRSELSSQLLPERYEEALRNLDEELHIDPADAVRSMTPKKGSHPEAFARDKGSAAGSSSGTDSKSKGSNQKASAEEASPFENKFPTSLPPQGKVRSDSTASAADSGKNSAGGRGSVSGTVSRRPSAFVPMAASGTAEGVLLTVRRTKNTFKGSTLHTTRRWYSVDDELFQWGSSDKPLPAEKHKSSASTNSSASSGSAASASASALPGHILVSSIADVRSYTTDIAMLKAAKKLGYSPLEIETSDGGVLVLGCEDSSRRDQWVLTIRTNKDHHLYNRSSYRNQMHELTAVDIFRFAQSFRKLGMQFQQITAEGRSFTIEQCGIDISNIDAVTKFLSHELQASGLGSKFLELLQELLLVPAGSDTMWDAMLAGVRKLRVANLRELGEVENSFDARSFVQQLRDKAEGEGGGYSQMSKLALKAMDGEQQVQRLKEQLEQLQTAQTQQQEATKAAEGTRSSLQTVQEEAQRLAAKLQRVEDGRVQEQQQLEGLQKQFADATRELERLRAENAALKANPVVAAGAGANTGAAASTAPGAQPSSDPRFEKYAKMKKMLPEGAVRQKMKVDGFSEDEIDAFFSGAPVAAAAVPTPPAPPAEDERFAKYTKMKKMLPEGAVRQKMKVDGFSEEDIATFFGESTAPSSASAAAGGAAKAPSLSPAQAIKFAKYEKMSKMLPEGAVRQKMTADGLAADEIAQFFAAKTGSAAAGKTAAGLAAAAKKPVVPEDEPPPENMQPKPKLAPPVKLKNLYWSKIKPAEIKGTIWHKVEEVPLPKEDTALIEDWFAAKAPVPLPKKEEQKKSANAGPKLVSILDSKRAQNVLIIMGKLRKGAEDLMHMIVDLDPAELNADLTSMIFGMLPTAEELAAVQQHKSAELLDSASRVYFHFNRIPRLIQRIECHEIAFSWSALANATASKLGVLQGACTELRGSEGNMKALFGLMLTIGNYLNGNTRNGQAYGVKLETVNKLTALKAAQPQKGSLLHLMAQMVENKFPDLMETSSDWGAIWAAAEISLKQTIGEVNQLEIQVNKVNAEFINIKDTKENVGLDGVLEDAKGPFTNPLYRRCDAFLNAAKPQLSSIKSRLKELEASVEGLMALYGENYLAPCDEDPCQRFFTLIANFARGFRSALDENIKKRLAAERKARLAAEAERRLQARTKAKEAKRQAAAEVERSQATAGKRSVTFGGGDGGGGGGVETEDEMAKENMFEKFHSAQEEASEVVVAKFRMKLQKRQSKRLSQRGSLEG